MGISHLKGGVNCYCRRLYNFFKKTIPGNAISLHYIFIFLFLLFCFVFVFVCLFVSTTALPLISPPTHPPPGDIDDRSPSFLSFFYVPIIFSPAPSHSVLLWSVNEGKVELMCLHLISIVAFF